ncbi:MAG TPA: NADH-quinone oxidoreductase subunit N [Candidatus Azoamicus sp. MARI]
MYDGIILALPEIIISVMACFILILDLFIKKNKKAIIYYLTHLTLIVTTLSLMWVITISPKCLLFNGAFVYDFFGIILKLTIISTASMIFIFSKKYMIYMDLFKGEYFVLCLLSILGMMIMISSGNFLSLYLGLELLSLPIYSLIIMNKNQVSAEASIKYFIMGSIASGIFLFGVSLVYGMTGVIDLKLMNVLIMHNEVFSNITLQYGLVFIIAGLIFKFGAVPFHMWVPDVYEGSPISVTMFIGTIPKIAALGMAYRLLVDTFSSLNDELEFIFMIVGMISLFIGNIFALSQTDIKRLLGYSAIAHVGFIFCGLVVSDVHEFTAITFYVFIYVFSSLGAFATIIALSNEKHEANLISHFRGLGVAYPVIGLIMLLFLLSLAGVPPTAGFYAKFFVLKNLISYGYLELALYAILMSVIGAFYYLKIIKTIFFDSLDEEIKIIGMSNLGLTTLIINGLLILYIGMFPSSILTLCSIS